MTAEQQFPGLFPEDSTADAPRQTILSFYEVGDGNIGPIEPIPPVTQPSPEIKQLVTDFSYAHGALSDLCGLSTAETVLLLLQMVLAEAQLIVRHREEAEGDEIAFQGEMELE